MFVAGDPPGAAQGDGTEGEVFGDALWADDGDALGLAEVPPRVHPAVAATKARRVAPPNVAERNRRGP
jgi:hypothetical protein